MNWHAAPAEAWQALGANRLRTALTMLGMIFGVAAVVSMMSIGAGAQQQVMAFIEDLGVRNLIVEAREAGHNQTLDRVRKLSAGLSFQDLRVIRANVSGIAASTARKRVTPTKMLPKPQGEMPVVYGVEPRYREIARLRVTEGRFFDAFDEERAAPMAVHLLEVCEVCRAAVVGIRGKDGHVRRPRARARHHRVPARRTPPRAARRARALRRRTLRCRGLVGGGCGGGRARDLRAGRPLHPAPG